jgi:ADP-L-glycero-D-manno-heptose 6-epimerase
MILLTGHAGFIGKNFKEKLKSDLICVEFDDCFEFIEKYCDWNKIDLIIHQGAISNTAEKDIDKIYKYNIDYTLKLFKKAIEYKIPVKYASSASIYGNNLKDPNPLNYYALSKLTVDYWVKDNIEKFSNIQGFRYFNVYGRYEDHKVKLNQSSPISKFIAEIKETGKLKLFKNSENFFRDFICVDDVIDIVMNNHAPSGIYDLGTGSPISFQKIAELVIEKEKGEIEYIDFPDYLKGKYQDYTCADMSWIDNYKFKTIGEYLNLH